MIQITCPNCGKELAIPDQFAGQFGRCNYCGARLAVPSITNDRGDKGQKGARSPRFGVRNKRLLISVGVATAIAIVFLRILPADKTEQIDPATNSSSIVAHEGSQSGITCDIFEIAADLRGDTLAFLLETDLPDSAEITVSASRQYFEEGDQRKAYSRDYFNQKGTVADFRKVRTCSVADSVFIESLQKQMDMMASANMPFEVASISDEIAISFVLPVRQSNPEFGEMNVNLSGRMVPRSGLNAIRAEKLIRRPLNQMAAPRATTASFDKFEIGSSYRVSRLTPLMPEVEPTDPLSALGRKVDIASLSTIAIRDMRDKDGYPWYRVDAYDPGGSYIGEGWINSVALMGQNLTRVE